MVSKRAIWGLGSSLYLRVTRSDSQPDFVSRSRRFEFGKRTQAIVVGCRMKWHPNNTVANIVGPFFGQMFYCIRCKDDDSQL